MARALTLFWTDESGSCAVEYSILLGCIATVVIFGITALGNTVITKLYNSAVNIFN